MSDERRDFPVRAGHGNTLVDAAGKVRDAVLEIVTSNLHDIYATKEKFERFPKLNTLERKLTRVVLNDGNFGTFRKLASSVAEAILVKGGGKRMSNQQTERRARAR